MASDIMLIPSLFEGLSIVTIEAQASGLPSIISTGVPDEAVLIPEYCKRISLSENKKYGLTIYCLYATINAL